MTPAQTKHARMVGRIMHMLKQNLGGEAMPKLAIVTSDGVKDPDVAWCSDSFLARNWSDFDPAAELSV